LSFRTDRRGLLLAAAYLALALHGLGASDILGDDEAREVGIIRDVAAGHWLWPRFNGETLPDKPILYHWLAALPCAAAGFSETAVRLPSAVAGAALVAWTAGAGTEMFGPSVGLVAAGLLATTPALFDRARVARPDVLLVLVLSAALGFAFRWWRGRRRGDATAALALVGVSMLAKGPVGPVLFALALGTFLVWQNDLRRLRDFLTVPGIAALVVLGLGWYAIALAGWGQLFVHEHLVGRYLHNLAGGLTTGGAYSSRPLSHHLLFYVKHLPAIALPWTPLIVLALWHAWRAGAFRDPRVRFLVCWAAAPLVAFTPAELKLRYYLLPSLPALALLAAPSVSRLLTRPIERLPRREMLILVGVIVLTAALGIWAGMTIALPLSASDRSTLAAVLVVLPGHAAGAAAIVGFMAGVVIIGVAWRAWQSLIGVVAVLVVGWMIVGAPALEAEISRRDSLKPFALALAARYPAPAPVAFYPQPIRSVAVYVGRRIPTVHSRDDVTPGLALVATEPDSLALARRGVVAIPAIIGEGRVGNLARGRVVVLEIAPGSAIPHPPPHGIPWQRRAEYHQEHGTARQRPLCRRALRRGEGADDDDRDDHDDRDHTA